MPSRSARTGAASPASSTARPSIASSLSSWPGAGSSRRSPAARSSRPTTGWSGVGVVGRAELAQHRVRLADQPLLQCSDQARLADAGLAREQHDLALAVLRVLPPVEQQAQLVLAADQRRGGAGLPGVEAALG